MRTIAQRHPISFFLAVVYGIGIAVFALPLLATTGIGLIDLELPGVAPFVLLSAISLPIAAYLTIRLSEGREAGREYRRRVFHLRVNPAWYLLAFVLLPAVALAIGVVLEGMDILSALVETPGILVDALVVGGLSAFLLVNWWEEAGWTGFALDRLQPRIGPVASSVVTTWMQAILHLPLVFIAGGVTDGRVAADQVPVYLVALFILPISVRMIITWLYNATGRSVPVVGLYHAGLGVATGTAFLPELAPGISTIWVYAGFAVAAIAVLVASRGRLGFAGNDRAPSYVAAAA